MNWRTNRRHLPGRALPRTDRCHLERLNYLPLHAETRPEVKLLRSFVELVDNTAAGSGELHRVANDGAEHGLKIESRADGLANLAQRFKFPNRPRQLACPRFKFLEQPHVLDGDHRLVGKGLEQCYLFFTEGSNLRPANYKGTDSYAFTQERRGNDGTRACSLSPRFGIRELCCKLCRKVIHVNRLPVNDCSARRRSASEG